MLISPFPPFPFFLLLALVFCGSAGPIYAEQKVVIPFDFVSRFDGGRYGKMVSEIPHLYVKRMLDALYGRRPQAPPPVNRWVEENWRKNPNLVAGDFQRGADGVPTGWDPHWEAGGVNQREPLRRTVRWMPEEGNPTNRLIRFTFDKPTGDSTGVAYYSELFPIEENARYRFQCRWRTDGPSVKVFIKCYDAVGTQYRGKDEGPTDDQPHGGYVPELAQTREIYRSQQNLKGPKDTWNTHTQEFTPKHTKYTPRWGRVMLYAYLGAGRVEFDDVVVKQIEPASPGERAKVRRPSLETGVTVKEIEETERRRHDPED